jgi:hypothetical protein
MPYNFRSNGRAASVVPLFSIVLARRSPKRLAPTKGGFFASGTYLRQMVSFPTKASLEMK